MSDCHSEWTLFVLQKSVIWYLIRVFFCFVLCDRCAASKSFPLNVAISTTWWGIRFYPFRFFFYHLTMVVPDISTPILGKNQISYGFVFRYLISSLVVVCIACALSKLICQQLRSCQPPNFPFDTRFFFFLNVRENMPATLFV